MLSVTERFTWSDRGFAKIQGSTSELFFSTNGAGNVKERSKLILSFFYALLSIVVVVNILQSPTRKWSLEGALKQEIVAELILETHGCNGKKTNVKKLLKKIVILSLNHPLVQSSVGVALQSSPINPKRLNGKPLKASVNNFSYAGQPLGRWALLRSSEPQKTMSDLFWAL